MTTSQRQISQQIIDIMETDSSFDTLTGKIIGIHQYIPIQQKKNLVEVALLNYRVASRETGNNLKLVYFGQINFTVLEQDILAWDASDVAVVESLETVAVYISAFVALFEKHANKDLGSLALSNGGMVERIIISEPIEFGPATRNDNYTQLGTIPIEVYTKEPTA